MYCADVLPNPGKPFDQVFTYSVPQELASRIAVGCQVVVPLGARAVPGFVVRLHSEPQVSDLKPVQQLLREALPLPTPLIELARWMSDYYMCPMGDALQPVLPPGSPRLARRARLAVAPDTEAVRSLCRESPDCAVAVRLLREAGGEMSLQRVEREAGAEAVRRLRAKGIVAVAARVVAKRPATATMVELVQPAAEVRRAAESLRGRAPKQALVLETLLAARGPLEIGRVARQAKATAQSVRGLAAKGLVRMFGRPLRRAPWENARLVEDVPARLTSEQEQALTRIGSALEAGAAQTFLLHGVAASGKTEVFVRAAQRALEAGRQAIILMPEISLTAQAVGIFRGRFGDRVAVLHSALAPGERFDEWRRIHSGEATVVIGARSALFAPCPKLGLIVLDEEHDPSYKQDHPPRYHARETAIERARLEGAVVVLASATPSIESFHHARSGKHALLSLTTRVGDRPPPVVETVDLRGVRKSVFTPRLVFAMKRALDAGEQIILFLNRRGYATIVLCPECGAVLRCPHCDVALVFHRAGRTVECHHCGLSDPAPTTCAGCGGANIQFAGWGTERVEQELRRLLPQARPTRMDRDTTAPKGAHVRIVDDFRRADADVLVGTQMVTKGFHFPGVTLVGVLCADVALNLPDLRAGERAFQLLAQVSGRCGRGDRPGRVIIQTYAPDHYAVVASRLQDYEAFFAQELEARREHGYPPFGHLCNVVVSADDAGAARAHAEALATACAESGAHGLTVMGPAAAPLARLRGRARWHLLLKAPQPEVIRATLAAALARVSPPRGVAVAVDVDPVSLT
jgi:primosomal protein N' (replication factor Y)